MDNFTDIRQSNEHGRRDGPAAAGAASRRRPDPRENRLRRLAESDAEMRSMLGGRRSRRIAEDYGRAGVNIEPREERRRRDGAPSAAQSATAQGGPTAMTGRTVTAIGTTVRGRSSTTRSRSYANPVKDAKREILVNCSPEETRVAVLENNQLIELLIERSESEKIVGNIYKGKIENVLPGISSAFVNVGLEKNAYLYVSDVIPTQGHNPSSQIEKMIARNEIIMLQVAKEAIGTKGVKVTMDISLPGRFLVYMPLAEHLGVSKNIEDRRERDRLRTIIESCAPEKGGVIIRTEAEGADEQALRREMAYLTRLWESIQKRFETAPTPSLVHRDLGLVFQTVRDVFTENTSIFLVDSRTEYRDLMDFLDNISPELKARVKLYEGKTPLFQAFNIEQQIEKIRSARVDLPSGGYIIIQEAEGLCAIDVNTGKFTGKKSQEETVTATNVEAAKEVARQLRLRNIGGIIVIDFIDMRHARNRQKVMEALANYTHDDRAKIKILPITRLGLIEMTRERKRESLFALLGEECPQCHASGRVLSRESMYIKLKREILTMTHGRPGNQIKIGLESGRGPAL